MKNELNPDYVVPPGQTIKECVLYEFAIKIGLDYGEIHKLLDGEIEIDKGLAIKIESVCGMSHQFILNLEKNYRKFLEKSEK